MMDAVYVNRDGANPELKYSLRTLKNVVHRNVWIYGGVPSWVDRDVVQCRPRMQSGTSYSSVRSHIAAACNTPEVSDPFMLWNDDFFAMDTIGVLPVYHRGPLKRLLESATARTTWWKGLRETAELMERRGLMDGAMSYDVHLPLVIYKDPMKEALRMARSIRADAVHVRTLYGAIAELGGIEHHDPKMMRRSSPFPRGAWLSSSDDTFRSSVEPVLRYLFPDLSPYEKE